MPGNANKPALLALNHVTVMRGDRAALDDVTLHVRSGEHVCILGPNGCGKSTLIKTITRECYPLARERSSITILGKERWNVFELRSLLGDRLQRDGVITGFGPDIDPAALGYGVTGFVTLELRQSSGRGQVAERLAGIEEILEAHTITGAGDMLCRVVARTNADLQRVIDAIVAVPGVLRTSTVIALATAVPYRTIPLVRASCR